MIFAPLILAAAVAVVDTTPKPVVPTEPLVAFSRVYPYFLPITGTAVKGSWNWYTGLGLGYRLGDHTSASVVVKRGWGSIPDALDLAVRFNVRR